MEKDQFDIPVVLIIFKRVEKTLKILGQIEKVRPKKLYVISDAGRNDEEKALVKECRAKIEKAISWPCEVIKNYALKNEGCYDRIGLGALWVFEKEEHAIFLEDDNYPEDTFFYYCRQMLLEYEHNDDILWVCGTNYLKQYSPSDGSDCLFTHCMLPCGWASWSKKFKKYYDYDFKNFNKRDLKRIRSEFILRSSFSQQLKFWEMEIKTERAGFFIAHGTTI